MDFCRYFGPFRRCSSAALAGVAVPLFAGTLAIVAALLKAFFCKGGAFVSDPWEAMVPLLVGAFIPGAAAGAVGGALQAPRRASAYGALIFLPAACVYVWLDPWRTWATTASTLALALVVGALAGGAGAVVGPTFGGGDVSVRPVRLSLFESAIATLLGAILTTLIFWII